MRKDMLDSQCGDTAPLTKSQISAQFLLTRNASAESDGPEKQRTLMDITAYDLVKLEEHEGKDLTGS